MNSSLEYFFTHAPKTFINSIFKRIGTSNGLTSNTKILNDVKNWSKSQERIQKYIESLEPKALTLLHQIYLSELRGVSYREVSRTLVEWTEDELKHSLEDFCWNMLCHKISTSRGEVYVCFTDFNELFFNSLMISNSETVNDKDWNSYDFFFRKHLIVFAASVSKTQHKLNNEGQLYRKNVQKLEEQITFSNNVSSAASEDEINLLFKCAYSLNFIVEQNSELKITNDFYDFINLDTAEQIKIIIKWWQDDRGVDTKLIKKILQFVEKPKKLANIIDVLWNYDVPAHKPVLKNNLVSWRAIPKIISEMWLLGLVEISGRQGNLKSVRTSSKGLAILNNTAIASFNTIPIGTPDFEVILPIQNPANHFLLLELIGESLNDDQISKYKIHKTTFIENISNPIAKKLLGDLLLWFNSISSVSHTLNDWKNIVFGARLFKPLVFHVKDLNKLNELKEIPQLMDCVIETIPQYGFIIKKEAKEAFLEIVKNMGLEPPDMPIEPSKTKSVKIPKSTDWTAKPRFLGESNYNLVQPDETATHTSTTINKYSGEFIIDNYSGYLQLIRYAGIMDSDIELIKKNETESIKLHDIHLKNSELPLILEGKCLDTSEEINVVLDDILKIRILT